MRHRLLLSLFLALALAPHCGLAETETQPTAAARVAPAPVVSPKPAPELSTGDAIVLGLVEGITEFLPVSSTGHLIIANHALGLESDTPLFDAVGRPLYHKQPSAENPRGVPLTFTDLCDSYLVIIQVGAIIAVVLLYAGPLIAMVRGLQGKHSPGLRLFRNVVLAFLPCAIIGLKIHDWIDEHLFSVATVAVAAISGAVLMFFAERWRRQNQGAGTPRLEPSELSIRQSVSIGFMQCLALWPGTSRSMVTMVGGYFCGLAPAKAAEFSFLIGLPTLFGAAALKAYKTGPAMVEILGWQPLLIGIAVAAVSAFLAVRFFVSYLTRHGLVPFAIYRVLLAAVLLAWFYL